MGHGRIRRFVCLVTFVDVHSLTWFAVTDPVVFLVTGIEVLVLAASVGDVEGLSVLKLECE